MVTRVLRVVMSALALALLLAACGDRSGAASPFTSTDITEVDWGRDFHLTDHNGVPRRLADFKGKAVMLFFGYIHCPDICPTTLADMAEVVKQLGADGERVQGLFVTVDPRRDTPQVLAQFVPAFHPRFLGLYADEGTTASLAKDFKIYYRAQPAAGADGERVQGLFVTVDPRRDTPQVLAQFVPAFHPRFLGLYADEGTTASLAKDFKIYYRAQPADAQGNYTVDHNGGIFVFDPRGRLRLFVGGQRSVAAVAADVALLLKQ
jgi:protein SCO1/2